MQITYYHFSTIDSTNNYAKRNLAQFDTEGLSVITAATQSAGRGRFKRSWLSSIGNVYMTFVLFTPHHPFFITQLASIAVDDALHGFEIESAIKWPNDLVVQGKKIAGILTEKVDGATIIGIGLNVALTTKDIEKIAQPVTSMYLETKKLTPPDAVIDKIVQRFHTLVQEADADCQSIWLDRVSWMVGKSYLMSPNHQTKPEGGQARMEGTIRSITSDGELVFTHIDGEDELVHAADLL